jgi:hypothetical protein
MASEFLSAMKNDSKFFQLREDSDPRGRDTCLTRLAIIHKRDTLAEPSSEGTTSILRTAAGTIDHIP